jgi:hypothetical protein
MTGERRAADEEPRAGDGPGPQSAPDDAGPPLTEEDGTRTGSSDGAHEHEPEPAAGGTDEVPRREQGGL